LRDSERGTADLARADLHRRTPLWKEWPMLAEGGAPRWTVEPLAGTEDLDGVLEVERASFSNPWTREMFRWELENSEVSRIFVLRTPAYRVAAFCSVWHVHDELHINNLAVRPECRRQGLALAILNHVLAEGARQGARGATLEVRRSNSAAIQLYLGLGFAPAGTRRNYYENPTEDALILWKRDLGRQTA
jgi:ribosomal-protein-alanine acetyltransferase